MSVDPVLSLDELPQWKSRVLAVLRTRIARPLIYRLRRRAVLAGISRASEVRLLGHRLRTDPGVFHPLYFSSSCVLAEHLLAQPLHGVRVLDMGTGAGPIALTAAGAGASVTACDVNARAVALARGNAQLNNLEVEVIESDLFAELPARRFDVISFNVPFFARDPTTQLQAAYDAGRNLETVQRFAQGCVEHLEPRGRVVIILSEDGDWQSVLRAFTEAGLVLERRCTASRLFEQFHLAWFHLQTRPSP